MEDRRRETGDGIREMRYNRRDIGSGVWVDVVVGGRVEVGL